MSGSRADARPVAAKSGLSPLLSERMAVAVEIERRQATNKLRFYRPYARQREFHAAGRDRSERLFMAGNQLGKTIAGGAEWAMHLTGRYPDWWNGAEFKKPPVLWAGSVTGETTRDNPQRILIGPPAMEDHWGRGFIPADCILSRTRASSVPNLLDSVVIRWGGGGDVQAGESLLSFKAYEKGREKWQGPTVDGVWFDEEPNETIYSEGLTRTNNGQLGQFAQMTFTPLLGMSTVVARFIMPVPGDPGTDSRHVTTMTIDDAEHYSLEQRARIIASYPAHEREARARGLPSLGSGLIFPVAEEDITVEPFAIPKHWPQIGGLDFGWDHPTAAVQLAWDRDGDIIYLVRDYRQRQATPVLHAAALKAWGDWLPFAWPHDGNNDTAAGENLAGQYRAQGLKMLPERATFTDGTNSVEAGLMEMLDRMQTGRWKVFRNCGSWLEERRIYHRKGGRVVKERDDVMSASRYAMMMLRFAKVKPAAGDWNFKIQKVV
ncbi:terminase large subunit domain-containing protein [Oryzifoliimicrobium ureilyticus]|uniref:terminase large subunit domain-containing protein n=1 Tax=Oryzifoliimicrobium ureilyticus TaxID=3113724 RepID=UPI0030762947